MGMHIGCELHRQQIACGAGEQSVVPSLPVPLYTRRAVEHMTEPGSCDGSGGVCDGSLCVTVVDQDLAPETGIVSVSQGHVKPEPNSDVAWEEPERLEEDGDQQEDHGQEPAAVAAAAAEEEEPSWGQHLESTQETRPPALIISDIHPEEGEQGESPSLQNMHEGGLSHEAMEAAAAQRYSTALSDDVPLHGSPKEALYEEAHHYRDAVEGSPTWATQDVHAHNYVIEEEVRCLPPPPPPPHPQPHPSPPQPHPSPPCPLLRSSLVTTIARRPQTPHRTRQPPPPATGKSVLCI